MDQKQIYVVLQAEDAWVKQQDTLLDTSTLGQLLHLSLSKINFINTDETFITGDKCYCDFTLCLHLVEPSFGQQTTGTAKSYKQMYL